MRAKTILRVLLIGPFMAQADVTIVNVATPTIHADLGVSGAALQLVVGGYLIAVAVLLITGARLGQAYGYRRAFLAGVCVFTLASLACGLAPSGLVLIAARVVQGAGAAVMFPQALTGIQRLFRGPERVRAISRYALALSAGAVSGQILGGVIVGADIAGLGWRAVFLVNVPVGVVALAAAIRYLPADAKQPARLDLPGVAVLSLAVLLVVVPLTLGRETGWPAWAWLCLAASVPALVAFAAMESKAAQPLLNVHLLTRPVVRWSLVTMAVATGTYYVLLFTVAQYLQVGLGRSPVESGLMLVPWVAAFGLAGQLIRRLPAAMTRSLPTIGCLLLAAAYAGICAGLQAGVHTPAFLVPLFGLGGLGLGLEFATMAGHLTGAVPVRYASDISGMSSTVMQIGGSVAVAAIGAVYLDIPRPGAAFAATTAILAALALLAAAAAQRATAQRPTEREGTEQRPTEQRATEQRAAV